jgi:hypothetical protein
MQQLRIFLRVFAVRVYAVQLQWFPEAGAMMLGWVLRCGNARAPQGFWGARGLLCVFGGVLLFHPCG